MGPLIQENSHGSSVTIVTRLWAGQLGIHSQQGKGFFLLATASGPTLGTTQPLLSSGCQGL